MSARKLVNSMTFSATLRQLAVEMRSLDAAADPLCTF